jgi:hypothetical protein
VVVTTVNPPLHLIACVQPAFCADVGMMLRDVREGLQNVCHDGAESLRTTWGVHGSYTELPRGNCHAPVRKSVFIVLSFVCTINDEDSTMSTRLRRK